MRLSLTSIPTLLLGLAATATANLVAHDSSFVPDYILRATAQNVTIACQSRYSTVLNNSIPAPPIYLKEGQTSWVRVFNDMTDQNFTLVSFLRAQFPLISRFGTLTFKSTGTV